MFGSHQAILQINGQVQRTGLSNLKLLQVFDNCSKFKNTINVKKKLRMLSKINRMIIFSTDKWLIAKAYFTVN